MESPFSNGTVEHYNLIVPEAMEKTLEDEKCESEIALVWAVSAKNALKNHLEHGLIELVFGFNIITSSVLTNQLPALEAVTISEMLRTNLNALHAVRKSFIEAESSQKIWRGLRSNVKTYVDEEFVTSDIVNNELTNLKGIVSAYGNARFL